MNSSSDVLVNYLGYDERDVEFERVISNIRDVDIEYGIEVISVSYTHLTLPTKRIV